MYYYYNDFRIALYSFESHEIISFRYIKFMKDKTALRASKSKLHKVIDDPWTTYGCVTKSRGTQTAIMSALTTTTGISKQPTTSSLLHTTRKVVHTITPDGKESIKTFQTIPRSIDNNLGTHFLAATTSSPQVPNFTTESPRIISSINGAKPPGIGKNITHAVPIKLFLEFWKIHTNFLKSEILHN